MLSVLGNILCDLDSKVKVKDEIMFFFLMYLLLKG